MSVDAPPPAVRAAVVAAFLARIAQLVDGEGEGKGAGVGVGVREAVHAVFAKYKSLADRIILDKGEERKSDQVGFLLEVQRGCERRGRESGGREGQEWLLFVVKECYDLEVVEEEGVLLWWEDERSRRGGEGGGKEGGDGDGEGGVRGLVEQFVTFLREAEEDDDEEEESDEERVI